MTKISEATLWVLMNQAELPVWGCMALSEDVLRKKAISQLGATTKGLSEEDAWDYMKGRGYSAREVLVEVKDLPSEEEKAAELRNTASRIVAEEFAIRLLPKKSRDAITQEISDQLQAFAETTGLPPTQGNNWPDKIQKTLRAVLKKHAVDSGKIPLKTICNDLANWFHENL